MPMKPEKDQTPYLANALKAGIERFATFLAQVFSLLKFDLEKTRNQFLEMFQSTSEQVREKAEDARRAVKLRMAVLEIEHHLNRLYPQIGKIVCDLTKEGRKSLLSDPDLKNRIEMAEEYRQRLEELKNEQVAQQKN